MREHLNVHLSARREWRNGKKVKIKQSCCPNAVGSKTNWILLFQNRSQSLTINRFRSELAFKWQNEVHLINIIDGIFQQWAITGLFFIFYRLFDK